MQDFWQKRLAIERGQLRTWARHGQYTGKIRATPWRRTLLAAAFRVTGLRPRGERNAREAVIRSLRFAFVALPEAFCGFTILHMSDLHIDGLPGLPEAIGARIRHVSSDVCVLTGDYRYRTHGSSAQVYPQMETLLACVNTRYGILGVLGNHDTSEKVPHFQRLGVTMLVNQAREVVHGGASIWFVGLDDPHYYGCADLDGTLRTVPPEAFKILLVHTPELWDTAAASGIHLYLCGHTHGGQVCLPLLGPMILGANCPRKYARGTWQHQQMHGYTNVGVGVSIVPVRFRCPPEIGLIELRCWQHRDTTASCTAHREHV